MASTPTPPLFEDGSSPQARENFVRFLHDLRAQGVVRVKVGADGSFEADILPVPPTFTAKAGEKPETPEEKLERELFPE